MFAWANAMKPLHGGWLLFLMLVSTTTQAIAYAGRMLRTPLKITTVVFLCMFIVFLSSGFNLEGNMDIDMEKQTQPLADDDQWLLDVEAETRAIEEMPFVKAVSFNYGETANSCKVFATLWCCWDSGRKSLRKVPVACDLDQKPTYLEALRALREKLAREHGAPDHPHHAKAVESRQRHEAQESAQQSAQELGRDENAFDRMKAAASRLHVAEQRAAADAAALEQTAAAELEAVRRREEAEARAKASKAAANELKKNAPPPQKKQKEAADSSQQEAEETAEQADPEAWESYSIGMFRSLFRKFARTSSVKVDPNNTDRSLPAQGDDHGKRGWRNHAQHGMYPHVRHWAKGSKFRVGFMLAELAQHFGVVEAVAERLNLKLTKEEVEQAKTDRCIVDRLVAAIHQLKQCRSEEERNDYGVVLSAVAPQREQPGNPTGMIKKISERLRVQRGSRYVKATGERRARAFEQAIERRAGFDIARLQGNLSPGDAATSRGQACTIVEIDWEADTCKLAFKSGGIEVMRSYDCIYKGKDASGSAKFPKGSARLRGVPPSLRPKVSSALTLRPRSHALASPTFWFAAGSCHAL